MEAELAKVGRKLNSRAHGPLANSLKPELDVSIALDPKRENYYQNLIGVLRWALELGRIEIHYHFSIMSRYLASSREGHLEQVFCIFSYLKKHPSDGQFIY